jgi:hypothetical protein
MGINEKEYLKFEMLENDYQTLSNELRSKMELLSVDVKDFDYSGDEIHQELKKASNKAYKDLKKREYELRNR